MNQHFSDQSQSRTGVIQAHLVCFVWGEGFFKYIKVNVRYTTHTNTRFKRTWRSAAGKKEAEIVFVSRDVLFSALTNAN